MNDIIKKYKEDSKYRAKIKLLLYTIFTILVAIYVRNISSSIVNQDTIEPITKDEEIVESTDIIEIKEEYIEHITVNINDENKYQFIIKKQNNTEDISKEINDLTTYYKKNNDEYYKEIDNNYIKTTKEEVFDPIEYDYLDLNNINLYLKKATKNNQEYMVYLKDIMLNNDTEDYFIIRINDKLINIDYTPLIKITNSDIFKYHVSIELKEFESGEESE